MDERDMNVLESRSFGNMELMRVSLYSTGEHCVILKTASAGCLPLFAGGAVATKERFNQECKKAER